MPLLATEGESKPRQMPPAGTHPARCYSVIDLGTQTMEYMGAEKSLHKIRISWELPEETAVFNEDLGPQPFSINKDYTLSLYEKANLRHDLESWRGKAFTEAELKGFDIFTLLGAPCLLTVIHKTANNGKTYANVTSISKLPKGMKVVDQINPSVEFAVKDGRSDTFKALPKWLQERIEGSSEWQDNGSGKEDKERDPFDDDDNAEVPF